MATIKVTHDPGGIKALVDREIRLLKQAPDIPGELITAFTSLAAQAGAVLDGDAPERGLGAVLPCDCGIDRCRGDRVHLVTRVDGLWVGCTRAAHDVWSDYDPYVGLADVGKPYVFDNVGARYEPVVVHAAHTDIDGVEQQLRLLFSSYLIYGAYNERG